MKSFFKQTCRIRFKFKSNDQITARGGVVLIDALALQFGLAEKIRALTILDPRKRKGSGFSPEAIVTQVVYAICSGGTSLTDVEQMGRDSVWMQLSGLDKGMDQSTLGEWLRAQSPESVAALQRMNREFVVWALEKIQPGRILNAGVLDVFFDDTQIEVDGKKFEGARFNYNSDMALSLQTLWTGPFVLDSQIDGATDVSGLLPEMLADNQEVWVPFKTHFYADSGSSASAYLQNVVEEGQFGTWSISYNKWTSALDRVASELPLTVWSAPVVGDPNRTQYAFLKHRPGEADHDYVFAVRKQQASDELLPRFAYTVGDAGAMDAQLFMEKHKLKGACERGFSDLLSTLDLHHPPCSKLVANQMFYTLTILAHNLLQAFKLIELEDDYQSWTLRSIITNLVTVPVSVSTHANARKATFSLNERIMKWFRRYIEKHFPRRGPGRPKNGS